MNLNVITRLSGCTWLVSGLMSGLLQLDSFLNPLGVVGHLGVYPVLPLAAAALSEGGDAVYCPPVVFLTEERPA